MNPFSPPFKPPEERYRNTPNVERARAAWGDPMPDWIYALARACDATSQGKVAAQIGISSAAVNQTLGNKYAGRVDTVEIRVRGELMKQVVGCPVLGEISTRDCLDHQKRKFRATNPLRVRLAQTCPDCPNREAK